MKLTFKILITAVCALALAFAFNFVFLQLSARPLADQILLMAFSTAALGYLIFSLWGTSFKLTLPRITSASLKSFLKENAPGLILALLFFAVYTYLGLHLDFAHKDTTDNFLDADNYPWMKRISAPDGYTLEMRGPHPYAYFILRPLGLLLALVTQNPRLASILLNTFAGGLCVLFAWMFVKRQSGNATYAALFAAFLGLCTAHIFLGSVIETYIFSAAVMLAFFVLLQAPDSSITSLVGVSLLTFGITFTNLVQNFIGLLVQTLKFSRAAFWDSVKKIIRFAGFTFSIGILLSLIHAAFYPSSKLFFLLSGAQAEQNYAYSTLTDVSWRAIGRIVLLLRTIFLYAIIAPIKPYVFVGVDGGDFPRFNFFKTVPGTFSYAAYRGLGTVLVVAWLLMLLTAVIMFIINLVRAKKIDLAFAFVLCVLFNFSLHINYGYEPFLYSPDWVFALILFVAMGLTPLAQSKFFQGALFIFLVLLAYNQMQFFQFIFDTIAPFVR